MLSDRGMPTQGQIDAGAVRLFNLSRVRAHGVRVGVPALAGSSRDSNTHHLFPRYADHGFSLWFADRSVTPLALSGGLDRIVELGEHRAKGAYFTPAETAICEGFSVPDATVL